MTINQITLLANEMTDENYEPSMIMGFVNTVIARTNVTIDANLPVFTDVSTNYTAISDNWQRLLFVSYASYAIKANDGSLNEADRFRNEFETSFRLLEENKFKAIADVYKGDNFGNMYYMNAQNGINVGWFTTRNKDDGGF
jgi:hypothetical protein